MKEKDKIRKKIKSSVKPKLEESVKPSPSPSQEQIRVAPQKQTEIIEPPISEIEKEKFIKPKEIKRVKFFSLVPPDININFMRKRKLLFSISGILCALSLFFIFSNKLPLGIDFTGGAAVEVKFQTPPDISDIRNIFKNASVQNILGSENEFVIRTPLHAESVEGEAERIKNNLLASFGNVSIRKVETVGASVGRELKRKAFFAAIFALLGILAYVSIRFQPRFAVGATVALLHDVLIMLLGMSVIGIEMSLVTLAAILAMVGYSVNDSIVIADRIREKMRISKREDEEYIFNKAINETLSRTVLTVLTVAFPVIAIILIGGEVIRDFAIVFLIGLISGTYSSIYIVAPLSLLLKRK